MSSFLECPICFSLLHNAVETNCGHAFCSECLTKCRRTSNACPTCRHTITFVHPSFVVRELVAKYGGEGGQQKLEADAAEQRERDDAVVESEDPVVIALQFKRWVAGCRCGSMGAFDMEDIFVREALDEFMSFEDFKSSVDKVNGIINRYTPGLFSTTLAYCCWPLCCCCILYCVTEYAIGVVEVALREVNGLWTTTGLWWMLMHMDGEDREPGHMDERFFLALRIDPGKARKRRREQLRTVAAEANVPCVAPQVASAGSESATATAPPRGAAENPPRGGGSPTSGNTGDELGREVAALRMENEVMKRKLWEQGLRLVRSLSGHIITPIVRPRTPTSRSMTPGSGARTPFYAENFPDSPALSPRTLRGIMTNDVRSPRIRTSAEASVPFSLAVNRGRTRHTASSDTSGNADSMGSISAGHSVQTSPAHVHRMQRDENRLPPLAPMPSPSALHLSTMPGLKPIRVERPGDATSTHGHRSADSVALLAPQQPLSDHKTKPNSESMDVSKAPRETAPTRAEEIHIQLSTSESSDTQR